MFETKTMFVMVYVRVGGGLGEYYFATPYNGCGIKWFPAFPDTKIYPGYLQQYCCHTEMPGATRLRKPLQTTSCV